MGPKFLLVFCGVETESVSDFVQGIKDNVESIKIEVDEKDKKNTRNKSSINSNI